MVFQEYNLVERLTVMENLLCGRLGYVSRVAGVAAQVSAGRHRARVRAARRRRASRASRNQRADALSGGQRQRVGIARAVMQQPQLLLADEPTSSLDPKTSVEIMELLAGVARSRGIPVLINMHDVELAQALRRPHRRHVRRTHRVRRSAGEACPTTMLKKIYGGEDWLH